MSTSTLVVDRQSISWLGRVADYIELTKPRIATLVLVVVAVSAYLACWGQPDPWRMIHALMGTVLVASSASALNQLLERRRDERMARTANRPLPAGRLGKLEVITFATLTIIAGLAQLVLAVNWLAATWALATWILYVWVYTPMKAWTPENTTIGAVSGALPVLIGWSAMDGQLNIMVDPRGWALFLVLFLWQFPHFMAIAWLYRHQYGKAGLKMLPVVEPSGWRAGIRAVSAALTLLPISLVPGIFTSGPGTWVYLVGAVLLGSLQLAFAIRFLADRNELTARWMLRATLLYLPALFLLLVGIALV